MSLFIIREYTEFPNGRVLLSLPKLVERLAFVEVTFWSLRQLTFVCVSPFFGIPIPEVEKVTAAIPRGMGLADQDFQNFLKTDMQIIDGWIDAYARSVEPLFRIECVDTGQWELSTDADDLAAELEKRGFRKA